MTRNRPTSRRRRRRRRASAMRRRRRRASAMRRRRRRARRVRVRVRAAFLGVRGESRPRDARRRRRRRRETTTRSRARSTIRARALRRRLARNAVRVGRHDGGTRKRRHRGIDLRGGGSRRRRRRVHVDARPRTGGEILRRERRELLFEKRDDAGGDGETGGTGEDAEIARRVRRRAVTRRFDSIRFD